MRPFATLCRPARSSARQEAAFATTTATSTAGAVGYARHVSCTAAAIIRAPKPRPRHRSRPDEMVALDRTVRDVNDGSELGRVLGVVRDH